MIIKGQSAKNRMGLGGYRMKIGNKVPFRLEENTSGIWKRRGNLPVTRGTNRSAPKGVVQRRRGVPRLEHDRERFKVRCPLPTESSPVTGVYHARKIKKNRGTILSGGTGAGIGKEKADRGKKSSSMLRCGGRERFNSGSR